jgi:hypothetical protein
MNKKQISIGISINEVVRDFIGQLTYTYNKYYPDFKIEETELTNFDFLNSLSAFKDAKEMNTFIYSESAMEIFAHADVKSEALKIHLNSFIRDLKDFYDIDLTVVTREVDKSIPSTLFFLSKLGCRATNIKFVPGNVDEWDGIDILITANPIALDNKPDGKISVKVKSPYNSESTGTYEVNDIMELITNDDLIKKVITTELTQYEEL